MVRQMPTLDDASRFDSLYAAHRAARKGKQDRREIIEFELNLGCNLAGLSTSLKNGTYQLGPYVRFVVDDPKRRVVHALRYCDRVVQHSLCDNVVGPIIDPRLIYDNAACRRGKGTLFALNRLEVFLKKHYCKHGTQGWFLKCDIWHYFACINHVALESMLCDLPFDERTYRLLYSIIEGYEDQPGCGLPLGNQTSQWFALYYLDDIDRLVKEHMHVRAYVRYMDDMVLLHENRNHLCKCLCSLRSSVREIGLKFNKKTQIAPLSQGIDFLGWHLYLTDTGKVVRRLRQDAKRRMLRKIHRQRYALSDVCCQALESRLVYLRQGDTGGLERKITEILLATR